MSMMSHHLNLSTFQHCQIRESTRTDEFIW